MKKLFFLTLLAGLFTLASSSLNAQSIINNTDCAFFVTVTYGPNCNTSAGSVLVVARAGQSTAVNIPAGNIPLKATGRYITAPNCQFFLGRPCTGNPQIDVVNCPAACGPYEAIVFPTGIQINPL